MLKRIGLFFLWMFVSFLIPICFLKIENTGTSKNIELEKIKSDERIIKLLRTETGEIIKLPLEEYIKGVVLAEMPITFEKEALKAQAIVARTYTLYQLNRKDKAHENADMCDNINCCQAYQTREYAMLSWNDEEELNKWQKLCEAVDTTQGEVITYQGEIIEAFFHAHSGGRTEDVKYLWNEEEIPYLKSVDGMEKEAFEEEKVFQKEELTAILQKVTPQYSGIEKIQIIDYTPSGRAYHISIGDNLIKAAELRTLLNLRSTNFEITENEKKVVFHTHGYGHGVGMSQYGANQMALDGKIAEEIIKHYYTGVEIKNIH